MNRLTELFRQADYSTRRKFMGRVAGSCLGISFLTGGALSRAADTLDTRGKKAKSVIYIFMDGGMSHLDTFDPKPDNAEVQGPVKPLATNVSGIYLTEYLPTLAKHMNNIALVRSMTSRVGAHELAQYIMRTSYAPRGSIVHPGMGAWIWNLAGRVNDNLPAAVTIGGRGMGTSCGWMSSQYEPLGVGDPYRGLAHVRKSDGVTDELFKERLTLMEKLDKQFRADHPAPGVAAYETFYKDALRMMYSKDMEVFDLNKEDKAVRDAYGQNGFGQGLLLARRLVEKGVRFIEIGMGGWDTHNNNFDAMPRNCATVDKSVGHLLTDLKAKGMLDSTLVVITTEFGRTPRINQTKGRDHFPNAFSAMLAGGGIAGGQVYGRTDKSGSTVEEDGVPIQNFNATIAAAMGLPHDKKIYSPSKRPFTISGEPNGTPITKVLA